MKKEYDFSGAERGKAAFSAWGGVARIRYVRESFFAARTFHSLEDLKWQSR